MKNKHSTNGVKGTLTEKQLRFVEEYLIDCNATAGYKRAGYKVTSDAAAQAAAARLLANPKVAAAIEAAKKARSDRTEVTIDFVVQETLANYRRCVEAEEFAAANKSLVKFLADKLNCARSRVELVRGHKSRHKVVMLHGLKPEEILKKLA